MVELLRPDADDATGNWTNESSSTPLYTSVDETTASDSDYIQSGSDPSADVCRFRLSNPVSALAPPGKIRYRYKRTGAASINLIVRLKQGTTVIASWQYAGISDTFTTTEETLTTGQYSSITDFNNLFVEFEASTVTIDAFFVIQRDGIYVIQRDSQQIVTSDYGGVRP